MKLQSSKIISIEKIGIKKSYDLETPKYHNFFLENGILSHNSTLAVQISNKVYRSKVRVNNTYVFKPIEDLIYKQTDFLEAVLKRWRDTFIIDEAINVVFNRDFYNDNQKKIIKGLNMNRDHYNLIILCVPSFANMDTQIKQLCKMRITVVKRGYAITSMMRLRLPCVSALKIASGATPDKR